MTKANTFAELSFPKQISDAIAKLGFENPTPVQAQTIPVALEGRDVVAMAETGSGKTAAYLLPTLTRTLKQSENLPAKQILILTPTRELAMQIVDVAKTLTHFLPQISTCLLIGGAPMNRQVNSLRRKPRLLIATPGRLMDHQRRRTVDLRNVDTLILDEADRMFDMGFAPQVREIVKHIPKERQTLLFSATFPKEIRELAQKILVNPVDISIQKTTLPPSKIEQKTIDVSLDKKDDKTLDLINSASGSVLVFVRTKHRADRLSKYLHEFGVRVAKIHGDRSQGQRNQAIQGFKAGEYRVLVATDIAARGIDVPSISDVINYDLPDNFEDYVHRIGRTGRAGREGQALSLITNGDRYKWTNIARKLGLSTKGHYPSGGGGQRPRFDRPRGPQAQRQEFRPEAKPFFADSPQRSGGEKPFGKKSFEDKESRGQEGYSGRKSFGKRRDDSFGKKRDEPFGKRRDDSFGKKRDESFGKRRDDRREGGEFRPASGGYAKPFGAKSSGRYKSSDRPARDGDRPSRDGDRPFRDGDRPRWSATKPKSSKPKWSGDREESSGKKWSGGSSKSKRPSGSKWSGGGEKESRPKWSGGTMGVRKHSRDFLSEDSNRRRD